ncbi:MAG TPA: matrixin family metalloprotease [Pyrinomonadaceae bacterium]|nr:matrixin family metalloprotease [Pyrinomonadaceae bacterium]
MRRALFSLCVSALLVAATAPPARPYSHHYTSSSTPQSLTRVRWNASTINITLSTSLQNPPPNIKAGSDVEGAARRALRRWSEAAGITFNISVGGQQLVGNDGVNLITVAAENALTFVPGDSRTGAARVFFDPTTGFIAEADVTVNPARQFSTDGTHDTNDLESTFVHEIGHMLGLEHSGVVGATMQPRQLRNFFDLKQFTPRTLSDDDIAGIRSLYNRAPLLPSGSIAGSVNYGAGAHVFAENLFTGRVHGSAITLSDGSYRIDHLPGGTYRVIVESLNEPVFAREIAESRGPYTGISSNVPFQVATAETSVAVGATSVVNFTVGGAPFVNLRRHGLSTPSGVIFHGGPMPLTPGASYRYYVGGDGVENVPATSFAFTTPFITIDPSSYTLHPPGTLFLAQDAPFFIASFDIAVTDTAKFGDYSLRAQAPSGELAYLAGAVVIDPYTDRVELNPIEANDFFVRQQYRDFLFREPEPTGQQFWESILNNCPNVFNTDPASPSRQCDRNLVSASFFTSVEFDIKGRYIIHFYRLGLGRSPTYAEFNAAMRFISGATEAEVNQRRAQYAANFVARSDFQNVAALPNEQFVNELMNRYSLQQITTNDPADPDRRTQVTLTRADLIARLNSGALTKAQVMRAIVESREVSNAEFNRAFVTLQYFGYLRRDPDPGGFNSWLTFLNANPNDFYTMVNGFVNSREYRTRFGQP